MFPVTAVPGARRLAAAWLALAGGSLGASALFALLLVLSRTPWVGQVFAAHGFFYPALVLHVNLSALIWFLAFAGALWSAGLPARALRLGWLSFWLGAAGTAAIVVSPFAEGGALVNNYIPVLDNAMFLTGLALFSAAAALGALRALWLTRGREAAGWLRAGLAAAALAVLAAALSLAWSGWALPEFLPPAAHYEALFWGPGHTLQFAHTLLLMTCWLALAGALVGRVPLGGRTAAALFALAAAPLVAVPVIHVLYPPAGGAFRQAFTALMSWGTWPAAALLGLIIAWRALRPPPGEGMRSLQVTLLLSVMLFGFGLAVGSLIRHDNAMVPAHYHGVIGAVTLAFMALALRL
ncbi:MAG TPA: cytochrome C oxidase subunit I, partial [Burkholderiales bacterium]|nr:cytochrome C oxidase subunit I [Burkholderiales bacterium]